MKNYSSSTLMSTKKYAILPLVLILLSSSIIPYSFASPESEAEEDIAAGCRDGQSMVLRYADREYVCVSPETADRWRELGLAKIISDAEVEDEPKEKNLGYNDVENKKYPGAPPEPPQKSSPIDNSECRDGYTLVFRFAHQDTFCTSPFTAKMWERLGLVKIIEFEGELIAEKEVTEKTIDVVEDVIEDVPIEIPEIDDNFSDDTIIPVIPILNPELREISDRIWVAMGYDSTNSILIEGDSGIIVIDTLSSYTSAKTLLDDFRLITDKPIKTIIYTQANSDLLLGSSAFLESGDGSVEIITSDDLMQYFSDNENVDTVPTHTFSSTFLIDVSGIQMELRHSVGENSSQTYILLPSNDRILIADSVYGVAPYVLELSYLQLLFEERLGLDDEND